MISSTYLLYLGSIHRFNLESANCTKTSIKKHSRKKVVQIKFFIRNKTIMINETINIRLSLNDFLLINEVVIMRHRNK